MEMYSRQKIRRLSAEFSTSLIDGWGGRGGMNPTEDYSDQKFEATSRIHGNRDTNLAYGVLCETISSNNKEKQVDNLSGNLPVNLQNLETNIELFQCAKNLKRERLYR